MASKPGKTEDQSQIEAHLMAVGKCINQWAQLEMQLFGLFSLALNSRADFAAILFYKDHAFRSKLGLTDEIVEARLGVGTPEADQWVDLCKRIDKKAKYRNLAAHFALWRQRRIVVGPDGLADFADSGFQATKQDDRLKRPREKQAGINVPGLLASVADASALHQELTEFVPLLKERVRSQP